MEELPILLLPAQMQAPKWRKDNSVTIAQITSSEITDEQFLHLSKYKNVNGWLAFKRNEFDLGELPKDNAPEGKSESPSQRLRRHLYALHLRKGGKAETFPAYYENMVNQYVQVVLDELDKF